MVEQARSASGPASGDGPLAATLAANEVDSEAESDPLIGRVLKSTYRILYKIGEGGMGAVYAAEHVELKKKFAVKVIKPNINSRSGLDRLKSEAKALAAIEHENIVSVLGLDVEPDGIVFVVMELLNGEDLKSRLERGPLDVREAMDLAIQVANAVGDAHRLGIIHRDLKPENIYLVKTRRGLTAKVLDFGVSKSLEENTSITLSGQLVGTPLYMSPEQAKGLAVGPPSDIYALGLLLFEMLSAETPFTGQSHFEVMWKHGAEPAPSLTTVVKGAPPELVALIDQCLLKGPSERPASMAEVSQRLNAIERRLSGTPSLQTTASLAPVTARTKKRKLWLVVVAVAALVSIAYVVFLRSQASGGSRVEGAELRPTASLASPSSGSAVPGTESEGNVLPSTAPPAARVTIETEPDNVRVLRDGVELCRTPCTTDRPDAEETWVLSRPGYRPADVIVGPSTDTVRMALRLQRGPRPRGPTKIPVEIKGAI